MRDDIPDPLPAPFSVFRDDRDDGLDLPPLDPFTGSPRANRFGPLPHESVRSRFDDQDEDRDSQIPILAPVTDDYDWRFQDDDY